MLNLQKRKLNTLINNQIIVIMKKVFTLVLLMALAVTGFAQIKSMSRKSVKPQPAQMITVSGREAETRDFIPASARNIMESPEETELS